MLRWILHFYYLWGGRSVIWDPGQASDLLLSNEAEDMQKSPLSQGGYFPNLYTGLLSQSTHPSQRALEQLRSQLNCPDLEITFKELWQVTFIFQSNWHIIINIKPDFSANSLVSLRVKATAYVFTCRWPNAWKCGLLTGFLSVTGNLNTAFVS